uniref:Nup54 domain-containing protein n=1 Tax=Panagrellus redivivus TaxID=6233 RepID=A0A7E4VZ07_PANRE
MFGSSKPASTNTLFGSTSTPAANSGSSLFGAKPATSTATGGSLFGSTATPATSTAATGGGFSFGAKPAGTGLFGNAATGTATATPKPLFGSMGPSQTSTSLFANTAPPVVSAANTGSSLFGAKPTIGGTTTGSLFGSTAPTTTNIGGAGQPSEDVRSLQTIIGQATAMTAAVSGPKLYGDDRDASIAHLNQLLAAVGVGAGIYENNKPPVPFDHENIFFQFRGIGYCTLSHYKDSDGVVGLLLAQPESEFKTSAQRQKLLDTLYTIFGSDPSIHAHFVDVRPVTEASCEIDIYVSKREFGRINAKQLFSYFDQKDKRAALQQQLKVERLIPHIAMDNDDIRRYLSFPPRGFNDNEWKHAILNNPEPDALLPYPIYGFKDLAARRQRALTEAESQRKTLTELLGRFKEILQKVQQVDSLRRIQREDAERLRHRILRIISASHMMRLSNASVTVEEETLQNRLQTVSTCLNGPNKLQDRLEKTRNHLNANRGTLEARKEELKDQFMLTNEEMTNLKRYLTRRNGDLQTLSDVVKENAADLEVMLSAV